MKFRIVLSAICLLFLSHAGAQIIYQSVGISVGDVSNSPCGLDQIPVDVDLNGIPDIFITSNNACVDPITGDYTPAHLKIEPTFFGGGMIDIISTDQWLAGASSGTFLANTVTPLESGVLVDGLFISLDEFYLNYENQFSGFQGLGEQYIGFALTSQNLANTYFGWMKVTVFNQFITLHDIAIRTDSQIPIITGETLSCSEPENLNNTAIDQDSRQVTWDPGGSTIYGYEVSLVYKGEQPVSNGEYLSQTALTLDGLRPGVSYDVYVRNACGSLNSDWVGPSSFRIEALTPQPLTCNADEDEQVGLSIACDNLNEWSGDIGPGIAKWSSGLLTGLGGTDSAVAPNQQMNNAYIYFENGPGTNLSASIHSPEIDLSVLGSNPELVFHLHDIGDWQTGEVIIYIERVNGELERVYDHTGPIQGSPAGPWEAIAIDLSSYEGESVHVNLHYRSHNQAFIGKMALDWLTVRSCMYQEPTCPADFTGDGQVNVDDFLSLNSVFGASCTGCPEDIDEDGWVNINDFLGFNSLYGATCY